jgi:hypothetical protein
MSIILPIVVALAAGGGYYYFHRKTPNTVKIAGYTSKINDTIDKYGAKIDTAVQAEAKSVKAMLAFVEARAGALIETGYGHLLEAGDFAHITHAASVSTVAGVKAAAATTNSTGDTSVPVTEPAVAP